MSRISGVFESLKSRDKAALVPYITAGDPQPEATVPLMHALVEAGADIIELGIPFSDPMADGPVIQAASERALAAGVGIRDVIGFVGDFRREDTQTPVVLMGYLNPVEIMGYEAFAEELVEAGVDGTIVVDMPPEEGEALNEALGSRGIDRVHLVAPTSTRDRVREDMRRYHRIHLLRVTTRRDRGIQSGSRRGLPTAG